MTCTSSGNTYSSGVTYTGAGQTVRLATGVVINTGTTHGVWLQGSGAQTLNIADGVTIDTSGSYDGVLVGSATFTAVSNAILINASGSSVKTVGTIAYGYELYSTGSLEVHAGGVTTTGNGSVGVYADSTSGPVTVTTGDVSASGNNSGAYVVRGVWAVSSGGGAVSVDTTEGTVSLTGTTQTGGVYATSASGKVTVDTADVSVSGVGATGVAGYSGGTDAGGAVMVDVDTTAGTVSLTGATSGQGVYAASYGAVKVTTGDVNVAGNWGSDANLTSGIFATSYGSGAAGKVVVDSSAGAVTMTGTTSGFWGVFAGSSGGVVEVTTANVSTKAASETAVQGQSGGTGATGAVTVTTTAGLIKTEGAGAIGINALNSAGSNGGLVTVHAGNVTTTGTGAAYGIQVSGTSGDVAVTAGTVTTAGSGASGIKASAAGAIDVSATKVVTTGDNAYGFQATGNATANVKVTVGEVETGGVSTGAGAHGVNATGAGLVDIESTTNSKITTNGLGARGVNIDKLSGAVTVNVKSVQTNGDNSAGIHVYNGTLSGTGTGGPITITAQSVITTGETVPTGTAPNQHYGVGNGADAIDVFNIGAGEAGKITIDTSVGAAPNTLGVVSASGYKARGIVAVSGTLQYVGPNVPNVVVGGGAIDIKTGTVTTTGDFGRAIGAETYGSGDAGKITIETFGEVSASGQNLFNLTPLETQGNYPPNAIYAVSWGGGDVDITTHDDVSSAGAAASAISAQSGNGDQNAGIGKVTINTTGGTVTATGAGSDGIGVGGSSGAVSITSGIINTSGDSGYGIAASNTGPNSAMTIDSRAGKITTTGKNADGIGATAGDYIQNKQNAGLLKVLAGDIDVQGLGGNAIYAGTYNGTIDIQVFGAVKTGATGGDAIYLRPDGNTTTTVAVKTNASVKASAAQADGMYISGIGGGLLATNTITIDGIVEATGTQSRGIVAGGINDKVTVNLGGSVSGVDAGIRLQETGGDAKVTNAGTVTGSGGLAVEFLGTSTATFDNDGTVSGNVNMYSGNDTVILRSNSAVTGNIDGKGGTDKLELTGAGTTSSLDTATILNFENGEKTGTGKWALTGTNASFASTFDVNGGLLAANATLANTAFTVASGATLGGTGTLKSVTVSSGGKLAPGNSIGTLHVSTATYEAGAIYEVEVAPDVTPGAFLADNLIVDGTATIDSAAEVHVLVTAGTYNDGDRQQILSAATRTGTFSSTVVDNSAFVDFTLDQSIDGEVWLEVMNVAALPDVAETPNQIAAAEGIDEQGPGFPLFDAIIPLDADTARHAFDLASGEVHATVGGVVLEDSRFIREAVLARLDDAFGNSAQGGAGADAPALELVPRATAWGQVFGSDGSAEGDGNAASYTRSIGGFFAGIDTGEPGAWRVGLAAGHSGAGLSVPDRSSSATIDSYEIAAYGGVESGAVALRLGGAYASGTVGTVRDVTFPGYSETLTASYGVRTAQAFGEVAYRGHVGAIGFEPFANAAYVSSATDGFSETGGSAALSGAPEHRSMTLASFGARFSGTVPALHAHMSALIAWQHRWGDVAPTANVAFAGGTPFSVAGTPRRRDSVRVEAGLDWDIGRRSNFSLAYTGQFAAGGSDHGAKARFSIRF